MDYCDCGAPLDFSPDGVHCVGCSEARERCLERGELLMLFQESCRVLQAMIDAGADVRAVIDGRSCGVVTIEMVEAGMLVCFLSSESPEEQRAVVPVLTQFTVAFPGF